MRKEGNGFLDDRKFDSVDLQATLLPATPIPKFVLLYSSPPSRPLALIGRRDAARSASATLNVNHRRR